MEHGAPPPPDRAAAWFDRLVARTELDLRRGSLAFAPHGPMERYVVEARLAGKLRTLECTYCRTILQLNKPLADGQTVVCPCCYGCYDIEVHQHGAGAGGAGAGGAAGPAAGPRRGT